MLLIVEDRFSGSHKAFVRLLSRESEKPIEEGARRVAARNAYSGVDVGGKPRQESVPQEHARLVVKIISPLISTKGYVAGTVSPHVGRGEGQERSVCRERSKTSGRKALVNPTPPLEPAARSTKRVTPGQLEPSGASERYNRQTNHTQLRGPGAPP